MIWILQNISLPPPQASKDGTILYQPKRTLSRKQNESTQTLLDAKSYLFQMLYCSQKLLLMDKTVKSLRNQYFEF